MSHVVYCLRDGATTTPAQSLPDGYVAELWQPRGLQLLPDGLRSLRFLAYRFLHMRSRDYALYVVRYRGAIIHHSCVNPRDLRYPFMGEDDLQIGDVETDAAHRGRGIAAHAVNAIVERFAKPGRTFWWIADAGNPASIRAVEKAGFLLCGTVNRGRVAGVIPRYTLQSPQG